MRVQKLREEVAEKERDDHFNAIRHVIPTKQEWMLKEKTNTLALTTSDDDIDLLDDDQSPLIKDESPSPTGMDINMVFMLLAKLRGVELEIGQICLGPKEALLEKPKELSQDLKPLYI
jgi:hypothetical protein